MKRFLAVCLALVLALSCLACAGEELSRSENYENALGLFAKQDFNKALAIFSALGKYEQSEEYVEYITVIQLGVKGRYQQAASTIANLYPELNDAYEYQQYFTGLYLIGEGEFSEAAEILTALGDFYNAASQLNKIDVQYRKTVYAEAKAYMANGEFDKAMEIYVAEGDRAMIKECYYQQADSLRKAGDFAAAADIYASIMGYKDAVDLYDRMQTIMTMCDKYAVGSIVNFGRYPVNAVATGIKGGDEWATPSEDDEDVQHEWQISWAPLQWIVLDIQDGKALIVTKDCIDSQIIAAYSENELPQSALLNMERFTMLLQNEDNGYLESPTWKMSWVRRFLNTEFMDRAFRNNELKLICETEVKAEGNPKPDVRLYAGQDTVDNVFILSISELQKYFKTNEDRTAKPTGYAVNFRMAGTNKENNGNAWYWTRNIGSSADNFAVVLTDGSISYNGRRVNDQSISIRPAMWISIY